MDRPSVWYLSLLVLSACQSEPLVAPSEPPAPGGPMPVISDGAHGSGNPDFFFRPPMVPDPSGDPDFTPGGFNPSVSPTVQICALAVANNAPESAVTSSTPCKSPGFSVTFSGAQITIDLPNQQYQVNWKVPTSPETYYRIRVFVGATLLGIADVKTAKSGNRNNFVLQKDGDVLPIKFRIERFALCEEPGVGPCSSQTVDRSTGGTLFFTSGGTTIGGITIPPQGGGSDPVHVTIGFCAEETPSVIQASLPIDLPVFGSCLTVSTDPAIVGDNALDIAGEVFICELGEEIEGLSEAQENQVTVHRYDGTEVQALPHAPGSCPEVVGTEQPGVRSLARAVWRGEWETAGTHLLGLLAPKPLYARSMMLDVGRGGLTKVFSDFQNALPAKMEIESGNGQTGFFGQPLPDAAVVKVTDIFDQPVANAKVHFATSDGSAAPLTVLTGSDGLAQSTWTLPESGAGFTLTASGNGIASPAANGPREDCIGEECEEEFYDSFLPVPYIPFDGPPGENPPPSPVTLQVGTLTFTATGATPLRVSGFAAPRNRAPLLDSEGLPPTDEALGTSNIVNDLKDPSKFGPSGTVSCTVQFLPLVQTITAGSLVSAGSRLVDVFFAGLTETTLTEAEATELAAFVNAGGVLYISGNSGANEGPSYHPLFSALGVGDQYGEGIVGGNNQSSSDPPDTTPITNGPFGAVGPLAHSPFRPIFPAGLTGLAFGEATESYILAEGAFESGRISAMGDPLYMNQFTGATDPDNQTYFLNLFALGCPVPGPE